MTSEVDVLHALIQRNIRQDIVSMHAYAIQDSAGMLKLDAMENPHRLPPDLQAHLAELYRWCFALRRCRARSHPQGSL